MSYTQAQLEAIAQQDAQKYGIDQNTFLAQIQQESGWNVNAKSPAGAEGIAQFMPSTAAAYHIDPYDPVQALDAMARYDQTSLKDLAQYPWLGYSSSDYAKMLAAYDEGEGAVKNQVASYGESWLAHAPAETQHYVEAIIQGATSKSWQVQADKAVQNTVDATTQITTLLTWAQQNSVRVGLFVLALALIGAGLFAIGGAID